MLKVGIGYDVHRFEKGRKLIVGGVDIPFEKGLDGHSDADVLIHAVMDAILGALGLGDIGKHFPDTSEEFRDIDSRILLRRIKDLLADNNYSIGNIDAVIIAQMPKMLPYIEEMRIHIAQDLDTSFEKINIKATTTEKLGFEGRGEGIASQAIVLLQSAAEQ